ncbi:PEP-utilizing enzyme [Alloalcanivorax sp. C16-2]|uniref:PEP-utilizing enzyme n=1 Tax=Alloalcanivorax TaxID=3020832 RepID=UPI001934025B|nr:PEP-utilizing enzyme [Alloalcanivorax marinus]MBL7249875.1 pyruvate, phosphate dikinase [Alloalcanivorax marinus]
MSIEVLAADERGSENVQRWAASGLPVPPSWRISREAVLALDGPGLTRRLRGLPRMFTGDRYWVLHQGAMNEGSQRESLVNLDSDEALAAALRSLFQRAEPPDQVVVQALPRQRAAGVLFTRHPLRQDLSHMVVEGVAEGDDRRQRLIFDDQGRLVYGGDNEPALDDLVGASRLLALGEQLRRRFERPQAGEWIFDGETLWLLQTLPVGSLPVPKEVWTRRAAPALFNQALTPLWYTLAGRWLKTEFWAPLAARQGWADLARVEPYRRQQSHLYTNSEFFRRLQGRHPGVADKVPPAWQPLEAVGESETPAAPPGPASRWRAGWELGRVERRLRRWRSPPLDRERAWRALMTLDRLGERLAREEGALAYLTVPDGLVHQRGPVPLAQLLGGSEQALLVAVLADDEAAIDASDLRPGADPVHAPLSEKPAQRQSLRHARRQFDSSAGAALSATVAPLLGQWRRARALRFQLGAHLRELLRRLAAVLVQEKLLAHPDDVFFLYFDELWELWMERRLPGSAAGEVLGQRKVRYLEDAHAGAPDWKMDRIGFGFGGGGRPSPVLRGAGLAPGRVTGPLRRLCSAWALNRLRPGDIVVVDQVDPSWVPWLAQAGGLVIAGRDPLNAAASLALACAIPAVWGVSDIMHSVVDGQMAELDGQAGALTVQGGELKVES